MFVTVTPTSVVTMSSESSLAELRAIVGEANVLAGDDAASALIDWRKKYKGSALAIVRPGSTEEVSSVVKWCASNGTCVVTQGGNTGLSGGQQPLEDRPAIVLSLTRMNAIEQVDAAGWTMTVQAGVTIEAMHEAAAAVDRKFAPNWGARGTATIGGGIATDAGGVNVLRYGNMRDQVMGLEVVLPDGEVWNGLRALRKDSSGYDIKQLFVASEGTLGVVCRAVVQLHPATEFEQTAMATLRSMDDLMDLYALANEVASDAVTAFELMPEVGVAKVCEVFEIAHPVKDRGDFYVLVELAGTRPVIDQLTEFLSTGTERGLITDAVVASTTAQVEQLWTIRDELPPMGLYPHQAIALKLDTAVPITKIGEFHEAVRDVAAELVPEALAYGFGHVGDGNIHMMVLPVTDEQVEPFLAVRAELVRRIDELTFELGGTLSAEHGVGREMVDRIAGQKSDVEWRLMRSIKATLDPDDLFNPGVMLPPA